MQFKKNTPLYKSNFLKKHICLISMKWVIKKGRVYFPEFDLRTTLDEKIKQKIESDIKSELDEAKKGIYRLPGSSRFGVMLAYRYYEKLYKKLKSISPKKLLNTRIRVSNFQKFLLIPTTYFLSFFRFTTKKL